MHFITTFNVAVYLLGRAEKNLAARKCSTVLMPISVTNDYEMSNLTLISNKNNTNFVFCTAIIP